MSDNTMTKEEILRKAIIKKGGNIKLGNMGSWMVLFGNVDWYIPELNRTCKGTCGNCTGCFNEKNPRKSECYVAKSYIQHVNRNADGSKGDIVKNKCTVKLGHAYRTIAITEMREELQKSLDKQLTRTKFEIVRLNESGELTCYADFKMWCELAEAHKETVFYIYTKNYDAIREAIDWGIIPENMFVNISVWHENGIKEYLEMAWHPQIRAFIVVDEEWTVAKYLSNGIHITTMCGAYDRKGKLNHELSCKKCKKCFSHNNKCCGCFEH